MTDVDRADCPSCGIRTNQPCVDWWGRPMATDHTARILATRAAQQDAAATHDEAKCPRIDAHPVIAAVGQVGPQRGLQADLEGTRGDVRALARSIIAATPRLGGPSAPMSPMSFAVLLYLSMGPATIRDLVKDLAVPLATIHPHVEREVGAGRIEREAGADRREHYLLLTQKAYRLLKTATWHNQE